MEWLALICSLEREQGHTGNAEQSLVLEFFTNGFLDLAICLKIHTLTSRNLNIECDYPIFKDAMVANQTLTAVHSSNTTIFASLTKALANARRLLSPTLKLDPCSWITVSSVNLLVEEVWLPDFSAVEQVGKSTRWACRSASHNWESDCLKWGQQGCGYAYEL